MNAVINVFFPVRMLSLKEKKNLQRENEIYSFANQLSKKRTYDKSSRCLLCFLHRYSGVKVEPLSQIPIALIHPRPFNDVFNEINVTFSWKTCFTIILQQSNGTILSKQKSVSGKLQQRLVVSAFLKSILGSISHISCLLIDILVSQFKNYLHFLFNFKTATSHFCQEVHFQQKKNTVLNQFLVMKLEDNIVFDSHNQQRCIQSHSILMSYQCKMFFTFLVILLLYPPCSKT